jgi:carboxylesterase type B
LHCLVSKLTRHLESIGLSLKFNCSILGGIGNAEEKRCHGSSLNGCRRRVETMALTQKKQEELLDNMARRLGQKVREVIEPPTLAQRIYPHLKRSADDQPKRAPIQGWAHLKEKR